MIMTLLTRKDEARLRKNRNRRKGECGKRRTRGMRCLTEISQEAAQIKFGLADD